MRLPDDGVHLGTGGIIVLFHNCFLFDDYLFAVVAVVDKNNTSTYKLGILLDGQEYYDTKTVRDREIVQPSVLKLLGWNLMHVWTIDWLTRPEYVLKKIIELL